MRVALQTTFAASRKEPLAQVVARIHKAFADVGMGEPPIEFSFGDAPLPGYVSSVNRVLKRFPELERYVTESAPMPGITGARRIVGVSGEAVPFVTLEKIAAGVPRSFPFHTVAFHFRAPEFGEWAVSGPIAGIMLPGVLVTDSWWVNGRNRSVSAMAIVEGDPGSKKLPELGPALTAVLAACGKAKKMVQVPFEPGAQAASRPFLPQSARESNPNPEAAEKVKAIVANYRARMADVVGRAGLPHDLPPNIEAAKVISGTPSGPKKPALVEVFGPMGYTCWGETGSFALRRRTAANLTVELHLDVGTWSNSILAIFRVWGLGFKATLFPPVSAQAAPMGQYPIGDADRWRKIVENLATLVKELEHSFVAEIEAAAGPSPEWYKPES
jgi:hypothetical protein